MWSSNFLKLSRNICTKRPAVSAHSPLLRHVLIGSRMCGSTPGHLVRHGKAEMRISAKGGLMERAVEPGGEQPARHADRHASAVADPAARPAGVDQPQST